MISTGTDNLLRQITWRVHDSDCDCRGCLPPLCSECEAGWTDFCEGGACGENDDE